jgi:lipoprotein signal peptidase
MITASTPLKDIFYQNTSVKTESGCVVEYNMNTMLDLTTSSYDNSLESLYQKDTELRFNVFKKLFPIDSIIKPFRPINSGVKYFVLLPNDTALNSFSSYRQISYPNSQPRIYYPGTTTAYKYWVTPKNQNVNLTVNYAPSGTKYALTNKIVVSFEKYHALPSTYTITITKSDNTTTVVGPYSPPASGNAFLYYNGSSWSTSAWTEPISYPSPISIKSINLTAVNPMGDKIVGVIEVSARWVKDLSSDIESFSISKESSASKDDILPVGTITANSLSINFSNYDQTDLKYLSYDTSLTSISSAKTYMFKNIELRPYLKVFHSSGAITSGSDVYDRVEQGVFFVNDWSISSYGQVSATALDSSKYLMDTIAPDILCESYPVTAILRRLLDSIGFTNYNFNLHSTETSIPLVDYFWTDGSKTIWENIQELCRDIQMNAVVDENNILQFYSRDYMYSTSGRTVNWNFYHENDSATSRLANIQEFSQKEIPSSNKVKVFWSTPVSSRYTGTSGPLWQSQPSFLMAGGLSNQIDAAATEMSLDFSTIDEISRFQSSFNFNGFFLIDGEILEFDAIEYQYYPINGNGYTPVWITSSSDINKYKTLSKPGYSDINNPTTTAYFRPTGKYRIKTRGAMNTTAAYHSSSESAASMLNDWSEIMVTVK